MVRMSKERREWFRLTKDKYSRYWLMQWKIFLCNLPRRLRVGCRHLEDKSFIIVRMSMKKVKKWIPCDQRRRKQDRSEFWLESSKWVWARWIRIWFCRWETHIPLRKTGPKTDLSLKRRYNFIKRNMALGYKQDHSYHETPMHKLLQGLQNLSEGRSLTQQR